MTGRKGGGQGSDWRPTVLALLLWAAFTVAPFVSLACALLGSPWDVQCLQWALRPGLAQDLGVLLEHTTLISLTVLLAAVQGRGLRAPLRLRLAGVGRPAVAVALVLVPLGVNGAIDSIEAALPWLPSDSFSFGSAEAVEAGALALLGRGVVAPAAEELFFRGLLSSSLVGLLGGALDRRWAGRLAILLSAAAFAAWHRDVGSAPVLFLAGVAYGWVTERSGSILPAFLAHALNNALAEMLGRTLAVPPGVHALVLVSSAISVALAVVVLRRMTAGSRQFLATHQPR